MTAIRLALCALLATAAVAQDYYQAASQVETAFEAKDQKALKALAARNDPDPWMVVDVLCRRALHDVAAAFAAAAPRQDVARLPAYVAARGKSRPHKGVRDALDRAARARNVTQAADGLRGLDAVRGKGDLFEQILVESTRGDLLEPVRNELESKEADEREGEESPAELSKEISESYRNGGELAERLGWLRMAAQCFYNSGYASLHTRDLSGMISAWSRLREVEQARGNRKGVAKALLLVGNTYGELGDLDRSLYHLREAERAIEGLDAHATRSWILDNQGEIHTRRGEYGHAKAVLERGLASAEKAKNRHYIASTTASLGTVYKELRDYDRAIELHEKALQLFEEEENDREIAKCVGNIGIILGIQGDYDEALARLKRVLEIFRKMNSNSLVATAMTNIGWLHLEQKSYAEAKRWLEQGLDLARKIEDPYNVAGALDNLVEVHIALEKYVDARAAADEQLRIGTRMASAELLRDGHWGHAKVAMATKKYSSAVDAAARALEQSATMLSGLGQVASASARGDVAELYELAIEAALKVGRPGSLFAFLEGGRAGALLEALEARLEVRAVAIPQALRDAEQAARTKEREALRAYQAAVAGKKRREIRKRRRALDAATAEVSQTVATIQREAKRGASVLYPQVALLDEVQELLEETDALVLYGFLADMAVAAVVTTEDARIVQLGHRASLEHAAAFDLSDPRSQYDRALARLRGRLIEPLKLPAGTKRLLISPAGVLGYVPFCALAKKHEVVFVPSGTTYRVLKEQDEDTAAGQGVLALGDPKYGEKPLGKPGTRGGLFTPIPASRKEAKSVGDVLLLGEQATEAALKKTLGTRERWQALHLACHGFVDPERPMRTALALAPDKNHSGLLTCLDLFGLKVPADLTVLSACDTGRGKIYAAEGIVGLTQAFFLAGSSRVLVSTWKVDDDATRALMVEFYKQWGKKGVGAAAALRQAQAHIRKQKKWSHPYYWAAWQLWGLGD